MLIFINSATSLSPVTSVRNGETDRCITHHKHRIHSSEDVQSHAAQYDNRLDVYYIIGAECFDVLF